MSIPNESKIDFIQYYSDVFSYIGRPLKVVHRMDRAEIEKAENRLGVRAPEALTTYYCVAGNETQFNRCFEELLRPDQWHLVDNHLVFYEAHQGVVAYGVRADRAGDENPPVELSTLEPPMTWHSISPTVTNFLHVMTYWQGVFGGALGSVEWARVSPEIHQSLQSNWELVGELNGMYCYRRPRQIACFLQWGDEWHIYADGATADECENIARDLGLAWAPQE
jgi:hypothetical protein